MFRNFQTGHKNVEKFKQKSHVNHLLILRKTKLGDARNFFGDTKASVSKVIKKYRKKVRHFADVKPRESFFFRRVRGRPCLFLLNVKLFNMVPLDFRWSLTVHHHQSYSTWRNFCQRPLGKKSLKICTRIIMEHLSYSLVFQFWIYVGTFYHKIIIKIITLNRYIFCSYITRLHSNWVWRF